MMLIIDNNIFEVRYYLKPNTFLLISNIIQKIVFPKIAVKQIKL